MDERDLQAKVESVRRDGYVVVPGALPPDVLAPMLRRYDQLMDEYIAKVHGDGPIPGHVDLTRILERDPVFEKLMDWPAVFPIARGVIGRDVTLAGGGEADYRPARAPAYISWHNDWAWMVDTAYPRQNFWVRCSYFLDDVTDEMGPFTLLPGSHLAGGPPPKEHTSPEGQPRDIPGMVRVTGKAGTCLINNTEIWHTNTPNRSDRPRKLIMLCYKHAWMRQWEEDGYELSRDFAERQTSPLRRQLCGIGVWHNLQMDWVA